LKRINKILVFAMLTSLIGGVACKPLPVVTGSNFDRVSLLTNMAENYIIPAYTDFNEKVEKLETAVSDFSSSPDSVNLLALRESWTNALITWQAVSFVNIGEGANIQQRTQFNVYPADVAQINSNITSGSYVLGTPTNIPAQGLQALDYLLYGIGGNVNAIIGMYTTDSEAASRLNYLSDLVTNMSSFSQDIVDDWTNSYRSDFIANNANNSAGSSISMLVNAYIEHFEAYIRKGKLGLAAGIQRYFWNTNA
jgi:predicted lipoprotein